MTTFVPGPILRGVGFDSFADVVPGAVVEKIDASGVTFEGDLTPAQVDAVWWFITSTDADDQAARLNISDLLTNDTTASPLAKAVAAYLLGGAT